MIKIICFITNGDNNLSRNAQTISFKYDFNWSNGKEYHFVESENYLVLINCSDFNDYKRIYHNICSSDINDIITFEKEFYDIEEHEIFITNKIYNLESVLKYGKIKPSYDKKELIYD